MMLTEQTRVPEAALPVSAFKDHLRLGRGFEDDDLQDDLLKSYLRAAIAAIEGRTAKVLVTRGFGWRVGRWRDAAAQPLPLAPVSEITELRLIARDGGESVVDPAQYWLEPDMHRPRLRPTGALLPAVPSGGAARIELEAGFGTSWEDVPADLAQAVMLLAAEYHTQRLAADAGTPAMPFGVHALIERWRTVRLFGGVS